MGLYFTAPQPGLPGGLGPKMPNSFRKVAKQVFLTMTSQNSHACVLRPEVSYSCPRIKIGSVDRDIKIIFLLPNKTYFLNSFSNSNTDNSFSTQNDNSE